MAFFKKVWNVISSKDVPSSTGNEDLRRQSIHKHQHTTNLRHASKPKGRPPARRQVRRVKGKRAISVAEFRSQFGRKKKKVPKKRVQTNYDVYDAGHMYHQFHRYQSMDHGVDTLGPILEPEEEKKPRASFKLPIYTGLYYGDTPYGDKKDSASIDLSSLQSYDSTRRDLQVYTASRRLLSIPKRRLLSISQSSDESFQPGRMIRRVASSEMVKLGCIRRGEVSDLKEAMARVADELAKRFAKAELKAEERRACRALACYEPFMFKLDPSTLPIGDRLTVRRRDSLTIWRQQLPLPDEGIPDPSLPEWTLLPLDQKIPQVPAPEGLLYFHRGPVGQQLHIKASQFIIADPLNQERVVAEPYNSLHDAHLAQYFTKPQVQKILLEQGLINTKGQVICTAKQFNKYRMYLRTVYNISLDEIMKQREKQDKFDFITNKKIHAHLTRVNADEMRARQEARRKEAQRRNAAKKAQTMEKYNARQQHLLDRYACHLVDKIRQQVNTVLKSAARAEAHKERLLKVQQQRQMQEEQRRMTTLAKQLAAEERVALWRQRAFEAQEIQRAQYLARKYDYQEDKLQRTTEINEALKDGHQKRAVRWQLKMEKIRALMNERQVRREERRQYLQELARKYLHIWLRKTREKKSMRPDENHQSLWDITKCLMDINKEIVVKAGIRKDGGPSFFVSFMRLQAAKELTFQAEEEEEEEPDGRSLLKSGDDEDDDLIAKTLEGYKKRGSSPGGDEPEVTVETTVTDTMYTPDEVSNADVPQTSRGNRAPQQTKRPIHAGGTVIPVTFAKKAKSMYVSKRKSIRWVSGAPSRMLSKTSQRYVARTRSGKLDDPKDRTPKLQLSNKNPDLEHKKR